MHTFLPSCCILLLASTVSVLAQGALTPPGPPSPTMKSLAQVEPRIPIDAINTPGDAGATFIISAPGSYYLTGNFAGETGKHGIFVNADNVTIDLNGFTMTGPGSNSAIAMPFPPTTPENTTLRNGTITNWGFAVTLRERARAEGLTIVRNVFDGLSTGNGSLVVDCVVSNNGQNGMGAGAGSVVRSSLASNNGGYGIAVAHGSVVSRCATFGNTGSGMFSSGGGTTFENCSASFNGSTGIGGNERTTVVDCTATVNGGFGIIAFDASTVQRCTVSGNGGAAGIRVENRSQVIGCVADGNGVGSTVAGSGSGIAGGVRTIVKQCSATENRFDGISVAGESVVIDNRASRNGRGEQAAGIRTTNNSGSGSRVEANHARDNNGVGIIANGADVVIRNSAGNNAPGGNFQNQTGGALVGSNVGPIGNLAATSSNPFANLTP